MAVRKVIRMGHPTLRKVARPLSDKEIRSESIERLIVDMVDTLHDYGGVGLAAPQIDESVRLVVMEIPSVGSRYGELEPLPLTVCVNPVITVLDTSPLGNWEGCLSIPGIRGWVERPQQIHLEYKDLELKTHQRSFQGFQATVCQHEFDHLDGYLFVDRVQDPTRLVFEEELVKYGLSDGHDRDAPR